MLHLARPETGRVYLLVVLLASTKKIPRVPMAMRVPYPSITRVSPFVDSLVDSIVAWRRSS
eukprot:SAG11_NODE_1544_length_4716_cov_3.012995_1_plen_61_part_00